MAGVRKASKYLTEIVAAFNRADFDVTVYVTAQQGDCISAVQRLAGEMDLIVCCGGDGTLNEVVNGLTFLVPITLGYIPTGSSNDLARDLEYPKDKEQVLAGILNQPMDFLMDVGQLTTSKGDRAFAVRSQTALLLDRAEALLDCFA